MKLDHALHHALLKLPVLPFMRLVRQDRTSLKAAREALAAGHAPTFTYGKAAMFDVAAYRTALAAFRAHIPEHTSHPAIADLYDRKAEELDLRAQLIDALQQRDDVAVSRVALQLYGAPTATLTELEAHLAHMLAAAGPQKVTVRQWIDAPLFAEMTRRLLAHYGMTGWRIALANRRTLQVSHSKRGRTPLIRIPKTLHITRRRARQLLAHEIEAHALRYHNGAQSGLHLLERGTAGYLLADEGIAMTLQQAYAQTSYHWPGFWESYAVALAMTHDLVTTYQRLAAARTALAEAMGHEHPARIGARAAWRLCLRISRGLTNPAQPGLVFPRDHVYLSGYRALQNHAIAPLYVGHAAISDMPALTALGITPHRTPEHASRAIVRDTLRDTKTRA